MPSTAQGFAATLLLCSAGLIANAHASAARTFVASYGADANPCSIAAPCRTFGAALAVTSTGGEVVVLDSAGYGPVTITRSVSILAPDGIYAGIATPAGGVGVSIDAPNADVTLQGLVVNGAGSGNGIALVRADRLTIKKCIVSNFGGANTIATRPVTGVGIYIGSQSLVSISDTTVSNSSAGVWIDGGVTATIESSHFLNDYFGIALTPTVSSTVTRVSVMDSSVNFCDGGGIIALANFLGVSGNSATLDVINTSANHSHSYGIAADNGATVNVANSVAIGNWEYGFLNENATFNSAGDNTLIDNGTPTSGTITTTPSVVAY